MTKSMFIHGKLKFKGWLCKLNKSSPASEFAYCKVCDQTLVCGKSELRHTKTAKHIAFMAFFKLNKNVRELVTTPLDLKIRRGKLKLTVMLAEKNLPLSVIGTIISLTKSINNDIHIAFSMKSKRTKTACLVKNVLAP